MDSIKFRNLDADELEVRVGEKRNGKMSLLIYKDARVDMRVLDETVGNQNWVVQYKREGETLFAGIGIFSDKHKAFLYKWSSGAPSNYEASKGEASDALKRSGFMWGIGRSLYTAPKIWVPESNVRHYVSMIDYDSKGNIKDLEICDWNDNVVYEYRDGKQVEYREPEIDRIEVLRTICRELKAETENQQNLVKFYRYYEKRCDSFDKWNDKIVRGLWQKWNTPK